MAELKLRRLTELNARLREDLDRPRVKVSEACQSMINYTKTTKDFMVPSTWGSVDKLHGAGTFPTLPKRISQRSTKLSPTTIKHFLEYPVFFSLSYHQTLSILAIDGTGISLKINTSTWRP
ncbi:uncharacterized protein H6S33_009299 [Morchella sextelata]|uniref:uncharacterized protein n=1 Tax=Morchella sextelata TaxID=1174677 RepID=UPI001D04D842|nr:uncharacterized protein H6S33_009299 [Morchella sextelata]KAH0612919.1 hypothetical protein H6S33_009299 [Morchella sextelata]